MSDNLTDIWADRRVRIGYETAEELARCYNRDNWRAHPENQRAATEESLDTLGLIGQIKKSTVNNLMFDGHLRVELALAKNPQMLLPVDYYDLTDDETALALTIHDAITEQAEPIPDKLVALLERTREMTADRPGLGAMLQKLKERAGINGHQPTEDVEPQLDKAAELQKVWGVKVGDLWELGQHRLVCGDCTDRATVEAVMRGERACTVTDPPYGVGVDYGEFDDTPEKVRGLIDKIMPIILEHLPAALTPGVPAMWDYPRPSWVGGWIHPASTSSGPWGFIGLNPILYYGKDPYLSAGKGRRDASLVSVSDRKGENDHPVSKPINVWEWLVERMTPGIGEIVFDPFVGSGTTIIAAENLGRKVRAIEIDPGYCAVTLERWSQLTGQTPRRVSGL